MITGINIVRNCIETGYPFVEAILSAYPMCGEYFVNDGGSTDGTLEVLEDLQKIYPRLQIFQIPDGDNVRWDSVSDQINKMIQSASGEVIFLGNADELVHENDFWAVKEEALSMVTDVLRFDRKEVKHDWTGLGQDVYHPARLTCNVDGLFQNWNHYGGDEFLQKVGDSNVWFDKDRHSRMDILLWHLYNMFPDNRLAKLKNDAEYLAPGDEVRVAHYERAKGSDPLPWIPPVNICKDLPALAKGLPYMEKYHVRECLFNRDWVEKVTGLSYS